MNLIFEKSVDGRCNSFLPQCDVPSVSLGSQLQRACPPTLPQISENDICRHYTELAKQTFGVNDGFYPLGSCTMKYNPKIDDQMAALPQFTQIHPLQPENTVTGCFEAMKTAEKYLLEITGMDCMTFQPAAGAHGEFTGLLLIKAYHESRGDFNRKKVIVPDSAHGTNPASATMAGLDVISIPSDANGCVDIAKLREVVDETVAGLMLTNPNTVGIFDKNILEITSIIHSFGGLTYYDGANLNAIMGMARPGDMGFDVIHINLHKTFATPHGGGGPGSGPVGCKELLREFLPCQIKEQNGNYSFVDGEKSFGRVKSFYGNFLVVIRALTYMVILGKEGIPQASGCAVLNANYLMHKLKDTYSIAYDRTCMHEFVISLEKLKEEIGVSAIDIAKGLADCGMHPPTMYFPLIVHEALMVEPTETESKETLDKAAQIFIDIFNTAYENPDMLHNGPQNTPIGRPDELNAARNPKLKFVFNV